jgi:hypothetical protein
MHIWAGDYQINVAKGAICFVAISDNVVSVRNLSGKVSGSLGIVIAKKFVKLSAGQEVLIAPDNESILLNMQSDGIARRGITLIEVGKEAVVCRSEFSMVSLLNRNTVMRKLVHSTDKDDKAVVEHILKMGACLATVTSVRGPYHELSSRDKLALTDEPNIK